MKKFGRLTDPLHQLCQAHGYHLAICDLLYRRAKDAEEVEEAEESEEDSAAEEEVDGFSVEEENGREVELHEKIKALVGKVRKTVKVFRRSPTKNDTLQKHVEAEVGHKLHLVLDTKTRWNSLLSMIERFVRLERSVRMTLIEIESGIAFVDEEITMLRDLVQALEPPKMAVEALCRRDATLLTAERINIFALTKLEEASNNNIFAEELQQVLRTRIAERRQVRF